MDAGDGLVLHCSATGSGPPVVMLHGFTGSAETWGTLSGQIAGNHEVIALDMPGHGSSSAPDDPARYSLDRFAADLAGVLDDLSLRKVVLLGYSMGGRAAIRFAVSHGDRLAGLILESTSPGLRDPAERADRLAADSELAATIERDGVPAFVRRWEKLPLWESQHALPGPIRDRLRQERLANRPAGLANSLRGAGAGVTLPVAELMASISVPTLVVAGELDKRYAGLARQLAASLPHATLRVIPDAGHAVHLEKPGALALHVREFLRTLPAAGSRWL